MKIDMPASSSPFLQLPFGFRFVRDTGDNTCFHFGGQPGETIAVHGFDMKTENGVDFILLFDICFHLWYIRIMDYGLLNKKRIGNPDLFTGRKEEPAYFFKWVNEIKERKSQSTVLMALRKMDKNTLMERLFKGNSGQAKKTP
jgi:hypothetical protein